jgi:CspA family cold shock protein
MPTGTVKVWSGSRGSGWIRPDNGGNLVYVHKSGVEREDEARAARLEAGQRVEFQIGQRPKGTTAINVRPSTSPAPPPRVDRNQPAAPTPPAPASSEPDEEATAGS